MALRLNKKYTPLKLWQKAKKHCSIRRQNRCGRQGIDLGRQ